MTYECKEILWSLHKEFKQNIHEHVLFFCAIISTTKMLYNKKNKTVKLEP